MSPEDRRALAFLAHNLRHSAELIDSGAKEHGSYSVPWNVLSWSRDTAERGADTLAKLIGPVCETCDGVGFIDNPDARYSMEYVEHLPTGVYSTIDPEEIDCPDCGGACFPQPTAGGDGCYCTHHPDDPAHGDRCYSPPSRSEEEISF